MSKRIAEIVVVVEDETQGNFVRRYLKRAHQHSPVRLVPYPSGAGSGEQFVRGRYAEEVKHYRSRSKLRKSVLIVSIDADTETVKERERQLEEALKEGGERPRVVPEKIALLIPKRNIETWILCLTSEWVDEEADYKGTPNIATRTKPAAENFCRAGFSVPKECVPSLQKGLSEIRRID